MNVMSVAMEGKCPKCGVEGQLRKSINAETFQPQLVCSACAMVKDFIPDLKEVMTEKKIEEIKEMHEAVIPSPNNLVSNVTKSIDHTTKGLGLTHIGTVLSDKTIREDILPMVDIMALQNHLERCIGAYGDSPAALDGTSMHKESLGFLYEKSCFDSETAEVMQYLLWKNWKTEKYQKMTVEDIMNSLEKDGGKLAMEAADLCFFFANMQIRLFRIMGLPITDDVLKILYCIKYRENLERVKTGSFDGKIDKTDHIIPIKAITAMLAVSSSIQNSL